MRKSCCRCNDWRARVWYDRRLVFPILFLNNLFNVVENLSKRSLRMTGGSVQYGGVQLERTYVLFYDRPVRKKVVGARVANVR